jgi:glyoxylase-like metal-dependent hydrolase (beta-lactamase superfamily II)
MKLHTINTGMFKLDGGAMFGVVPKSLWNKSNPADEANMCTWAMRCLLVEQDDRLVLIDTGIGNKQDAKFFSHYFLHGADSLERSIQQAGFSMDDITDVFLTHLHFDHVGGAIKKENGQLLPAFKNATYWSNKIHWNWATHPNDREKASFLKENILPIRESGQLKMITTPEGEEWIKGFRIKYVSGHTEDMMLPLLDYDGKTILYCADLLPSAAHIPLPWIMGYDMKPLHTLEEKKRILAEAAAGNWFLFFEHDPEIEVCTLNVTEKGIRAGDTFTLNAI